MKCAIYLADGFETCEGLITVDMLRRANVEVVTISIKDNNFVRSSHGIEMLTDDIFMETDPEDFDVLILPGGKKGTDNLEQFDDLREAVKAHFEAGKLTCAICAAPSILGHMGLLKDRKYTCFPTFEDPSYEGEYQQVPAVRDGNLITGRGMGATIEFAREIIKVICDEETLRKVEYGIQYEHMLCDDEQ
ncbi:MAG: DJ-1/PfpI family protein [Erysipelotrichaceae bacterium]|jgi:4-methyl-5(b-hydroxyethyl)-thiazole monophosphate biosynthesis|nr:DJ-1/PfpI family protein [Erysipelotrichaceae bacterium]